MITQTWTPLVTGLPGLHDSAASAGALWEKISKIDTLHCRIFHAISDNFDADRHKKRLLKIIYAACQVVISVPDSGFTNCTYVNRQPIS